MELPKRKQNRLTEYDYSMPNAYFITICTENRKNLFWRDMRAIIDQPQNVPLTGVGTIVQWSVMNIPKHYPMISVDHFVIMPNHLHLLLQIHADVGGRPIAAPTISMVINQTKGVVSKKAGFSVWQKGFHDHVIRNEKDYLEIWNYIDGNPSKWEEDCFYVKEE